MNRCFKVFCVTAVVTGLPAFGQVNTATVYADVTDPSGATVANAQASLENTATGTTLTTKSGAAGEISFPVVPAGTYRLEVTAPGFAPKFGMGWFFPRGRT
ncbi:MAG: carboxypeptidase regulatory-like domain-containing protein [Acidobacteriaceae bacterium]|nr:carboxypeptidase regulatory-like domain-containing protein [Acidobacteriaceae bacterium]